MRTNWKKVAEEIDAFRIPVEVSDLFIADGDAGAFRNACRGLGVKEETIDTEICSLEAVADMLPDTLKNRR